MIYVKPWSREKLMIKSSGIENSYAELYEWMKTHVKKL